MTDLSWVIAALAPYTSSRLLEKARLVDGCVHLPSRNERYAGRSLHGVWFSKHTIQICGIAASIVVPTFPSIVEYQLPPSLLMRGDSVQFTYLWKRLEVDILSGAVSLQISKPELDEILAGDHHRWTWHHLAEPGRMALVDRSQHRRVGHTGGSAIWRGGRKRRRKSRQADNV